MSSQIQWFPGHMARARRQVQEALKLVDVAIELLDARIPVSSGNPLINQILGQKPRLVVLNKSDLADPALTKLWLKALERPGVKVIALDTLKGEGLKEVPRAAAALVAEQMAKLAARGRRPRAIRCLVLGIPNVGKSSFINRLVGRKAAKTGDLPGVTKGQQWIRVQGSLELLDTPGILWPKFEDPQVGYKLAITGAIKEQVFDIYEVAVRLLGWLASHYPDRLKERYRLSELPQNIPDLLAAIGARRGLLVAGGTVDVHKAAQLLLKEFREGLLGRYTLDMPPFDR
ncbi:ribosome biogenesis GTPase YlqF [Desulforamulus hydrothermalis]|uniref:Ribosome biogenesis GTPase A n=1 Tax=Desulforamulus hydrothermalis Lam5 = DSM 18033 TaxID=1121428 RepID=K8EA56_9FIRM|nr:ribosome biogenesis GTPase YlqF [Desulforamulus hydrothermalis]CCO08473.1 Ribosome biogenesis GTPase A [Desulforamulus hydrothermalis Lam5 = DSM 18033]SHH29141.1 ribosome biogenesis GTPase A [Desulforamulus hydrothermalis Lam5 = DSM 18033]